LTSRFDARQFDKNEFDDKKIHKGVFHAA